MISRLIVRCLLIGAWHAVAASASPSIDPKLPQAMLQGDAVLLSLQLPENYELAYALFAGKVLRLQPLPQPKKRRTNHLSNYHEAVVAAPTDSVPGLYSVKIALLNRHGDAWHFVRQIEIKQKRWGIEHLTVPRKFAELSAQQRRRAKQEKQQIRTAFTQSAKQRLWKTDFQRPVAGKITSPFGIRRRQNNKPRSPHWGTDFRAAVGTPVRATNHGQVLLTGEFFIPGNCVFVDHGNGLITGYSHLDKILVEHKQEVIAGEVIGYSGSSGRVNGPHLHWSAYWKGNMFNPLSLLNLY